MVQFSKVTGGLSVPQPLGSDPRHGEQCGTCADQELQQAGAVIPHVLRGGLNASAGAQSGSPGA